MSIGLRRHDVTICPRCESKEVTHRGMISQDAYSNLFVCMSCGYQGPFFPEVPQAEAKKLHAKKRNFMPSRMPITATTSAPLAPGILLGYRIIVALLALMLLFFLYKAASS